MARVAQPARTRALSAPDPTRLGMRHALGRWLGTAEVWL